MDYWRVSAALVISSEWYPTIWRLIFLLGTLFGFGSFILIYIVMWFAVPKELKINPKEI